jgi:hypothetical protein
MVTWIFSNLAPRITFSASAVGSPYLYFTKLDASHECPDRGP